MGGSVFFFLSLSTPPPADRFSFDGMLLLLEDGRDDRNPFQDRPTQMSHTFPEIIFFFFFFRLIFWASIESELELGIESF